MKNMGAYMNYGMEKLAKDLKDSARDLLGALSISHDTASVEVGKNSSTNLVIVSLSGKNHKDDAGKLENVIRENKLAETGGGVQIDIKSENPEATKVIISSVKPIKDLNEIIGASKKHVYDEMDKAEKLKQSNSLKGDVPEEAGYVRQYLDKLVKDKTTDNSHSEVSYVPNISMDGSGIEHKFEIVTHTYNGKLDSLRSELSKEVEAAGGSVNPIDRMNPEARIGACITVECNNLKDFAKNLGFKKGVGQESPGSAISGAVTVEKMGQERRYEPVHV
jgi:hypothetical protein